MLLNDLGDERSEEAGRSFRRVAQVATKVVEHLDSVVLGVSYKAGTECRLAYTFVVSLLTSQ